MVHSKCKLLNHFLLLICLHYNPNRSTIARFVPTRVNSGLPHRRAGTSYPGGILPCYTNTVHTSSLISLAIAITRKGGALGDHGQAQVSCLYILLFVFIFICRFYCSSASCFSCSFAGRFVSSGLHHVYRSVYQLIVSISLNVIAFTMYNGGTAKDLLFCCWAVWSCY